MTWVLKHFSFYYLQWAFYLTQLICNFCCLTDTNNSIISIWLFLLVYTIHTIRWPESMELFTAIFHSYNWSKVSIGYRAPTFDEFYENKKSNKAQFFITRICRLLQVLILDTPLSIDLLFSIWFIKKLSFQVI